MSAARLLVLVALAGLAGCDELARAFGIDPEESPTTYPCNVRPNRQVSGTWLISGSGHREGCRDERLNGPFGMGSVPLEVVGHAPSGDGPTPLGLAEEPPEAPLQFRFSGSVRGSCVTFSLYEMVPEGSMSWQFSHRPAEYLDPVGSPDLSGTVTGSGPDGCRATGTFSVNIVPDPRPPWAQPDAGLLDAGADGDAEPGADTGPEDAGPEADGASSADVPTQDAVSPPDAASR